MKEFFKSWRQFTGNSVPKAKDKLNEGWTGWDTAADRAETRAIKKAEAEAKAKAEAESPAGIKKAKLTAAFNKLSPVANSLKQDEWDGDYLYRLPYMIAYKFSEKTDGPPPSDPSFQEVLDNLVSAAEPVLRSEFQKWAAEGREKFKKDLNGDWWRSEGYKQFVVQPAEQLVSQL